LLLWLGLGGFLFRHFLWLNDDIGPPGNRLALDWLRLGRCRRGGRRGGGRGLRAPDVHLVLCRLRGALWKGDGQGKGRCVGSYGYNEAGTPSTLAELGRANYGIKHSDFTHWRFRAGNLAVRVSIGESASGAGGFYSIDGVLREQKVSS